MNHEPRQQMVSDRKMPPGGLPPSGRPLWLFLAAVAVAGCKTGEFSSCISPRVTGHVIAADSHQPLAGVKVRRVSPEASQNFDQAAKGGQLMERSPTVTTDQQGEFVLDAERALTPLMHASWYAVTLSFERDGYMPFRTNFTISSVSGHMPDGTPVVAAGDIRLNPVAK